MSKKSQLLDIISFSFFLTPTPPPLYTCEVLSKNPESTTSKHKHPKAGVKTEAKAFFPRKSTQV